jgi:hypothetical protein
MENNPTDELFSIRLNKTGIASIRLLAKMINVVLILAIISWAAVMFDQIHMQIKFQDDPGIEYMDDEWIEYMDDEWMIFQWKYSYWITYGYLVAWLLIWIFTWKFVHGISRGLKEMNEQLFNQAFRKLVIAFVFGLIEIVLNMAMYTVVIRNSFYT